jgi:hypothetical protein
VTVRHVARTGLGVALLALVGLTAGPDPAGAQDHAVACDLCLELAGTYGALLGEEKFEHSEHGPGIEVIARRSWESGWGLGAGGRLSSLGIHNGPQEGEEIEILGVFVEPRFTMAHESPLRPFVGGRLELMELEGPAGSDGALQIGMVGGLDYRLSSSVTLTGSAHSTAIFLGGQTAAGRELRGGIRVQP